MNPLISIVIPTFNREKEIKRALNSIFKQTYKNWEILIIDNNSADGTLSIVKSFKDKRIRTFKINNQGIIASSRNVGIKNSRGDYIAFLDSDDWWVSDKLETVVKYIGDYDFIYHNLWVSKENNMYLLNKITQYYFYSKARLHQVDSPVYDDLINNGNPIPTSSVVVSKQIITKVGGFSEDKNLIAAEDFDCWIRISKLTEKFKFISEVKGFYHIGNNTSSSELTYNNLQQLYQLYLINHEKNEIPIWYLYSVSRSLYLMEDCLKAQEALKLILKRKTSFMIKAKVLFMFILNSFKVRKLT